MVSYSEYTTLTFCLTLGVHSKLMLRKAFGTHPAASCDPPGTGGSAGGQPQGFIFLIRHPNNRQNFILTTGSPSRIGRVAACCGVGSQSPALYRFRTGSAQNRTHSYSTQVDFVPLLPRFQSPGKSFLSQPADIQHSRTRRELDNARSDGYYGTVPSRGNRYRISRSARACEKQNAQDNAQNVVY